MPGKLSVSEFAKLYKAFKCCWSLGDAYNVIGAGALALYHKAGCKVGKPKDARKRKSGKGSGGS